MADRNDLHRRPGPVGAALVDEFHSINAQVVAFFESVADEHLQRRTDQEGWSLAAAGMHIAVSHLVITTWLHRLTSGLPMLETLDDFAVNEAYDANEYADSKPARVLDRLRLYGEAAEDFLVGLTDQELATPARGTQPSQADGPGTADSGSARSSLTRGPPGRRSARCATRTAGPRVVSPSQE